MKPVEKVASYIIKVSLYLILCENKILEKEYISHTIRIYALHLMRMTGECSGRIVQSKWRACAIGSPNITMCVYPAHYSMLT